MLLGQLEKMDGDVSGKNVDTTRQVTAKILHLIQTQGKENKTLTEKPCERAHKWRWLWMEPTSS